MTEAVSAKNALAEAMRELLETRSFSSVSVSELCRICGINRKSFYYYFKDKYDLVCRIFEDECIRLRRAAPGDELQFLYALCRYLDDNRRFYAKVLRIGGQNSFRTYFGDAVARRIRFYYRETVADAEDLTFLSHFLAGALLSSFFEWITDPNPVSPRVFMEQLHRCVTILRVAT